ncbi:protein DMP4-like [Salvia miltiorrhiza]|uniref:protein DMP4-like n=1 Tax=Salvia miltiorrhiza TaxID=226208 RepID=UPI0025AC97D3|nr:protein DMP4-like [Salvia miltiorrhiza]
MKPSSSTSRPVQKTLASAANLANLLPSGTVLAFQTLAPSFSNKGVCHLSNRYLTAWLIGACSVVCFLSSFTDSFTDSEGRLHYGVATWKGMMILNGDDDDDDEMDLSRFRVRLIDLFHAWAALAVFMAFALCDANVQGCFFPWAAPELVVNLPLAAGVFSTFFFTIFPTTRRGIGYSCQR